MNTSTNVFKDDPTATYRGYRRQALYCLFRLFDEGLPENYIIHPEGNEDLAILDQDGNKIEVVQVKDYSAKLTASSFKPSFYRRISKYCGPGSKVAVKIATFGEVGPEFASAFDNDQETPQRALNTLIKDRESVDSQGKKIKVPGISEQEAKDIFAHVQLAKVEEEFLEKSIFEKLNSINTSGDPKRAFENLMWSLISSAEKQRKITRAQTIEQLNQIGRFIDHRAAHEHEWNISIKPIEYPATQGLEEERLRSEFFQGGRVRARHIAANLDVPRVTALHEIHKLFQQDNVVIIRAASGQGKTTLAYRYMLEWAPDDFRYEILQANDLQHARRMSAAIRGHWEAIEVPTVVYLDVRPGDTLWVEFVRELSEVISIRILVTIREEDWFRSRVTKEEFSFSELSVEFDEATARGLYGVLKLSGYGSAVLDFNEAWSRLGDRKTLFEFVYLTTQNEQLSDKIKTQISTLKDQVNAGALGVNELELLRLVAIASAYEARLKLKELVKQVGIAEPTRTLERFSNEYLLRTSDDGRNVEGFHAIRSEIIAVELSDDVLQPRGEIEAEVLQLLVEDDLESFLLSSFSRNQQSADCVFQSLKSVSVKTWVGIRGVFTALQWLGLKLYAIQNAEIIDDVREKFGSGWWILLDWDLAQIRSEVNFFQFICEVDNEYLELAKIADSFQKKQSEKNEVFKYIEEWLSTVSKPLDEPTSVEQLMALSEVLLWCGHLKITNDSFREWFHKGIIESAWNLLPIRLFGEFAFGIRRYSPVFYEKWLGENKECVYKKLLKKLLLIGLVEEKDSLISHFIIDFDGDSQEQSSTEVKASINDLAVERVEVISRCLPGYKEYGATGYGHLIAMLGVKYDESIKHMPCENISIPWLPDFNALARGVVEYRFRPVSWDDYFDRIRTIRNDVINSLKDLRSALKNIKSNGGVELTDPAAWDYCTKNLRYDYYLPKNAVDEWGFISETKVPSFSDRKKINSFGSNMKKYSTFKRYGAISQLESLNKAIQEYTRTVKNFMTQSIHAQVLLASLKTAKNEDDRKRILEKASEMGYAQNSIRLSVLNGIDACCAVRDLHHVEKQIAKNFNKMHGISISNEKEINEFIKTMSAWSWFCYPEQFLTKSDSLKKKYRNQVSLYDSLKHTKNRIKDSLQRLKSEGIRARILSDNVQWEQETALWISFDTIHPIKSLEALTTMWYSLVEAFRPDQTKIVRLKSSDFYWKKIVLVPLVKGSSLRREAFPQMSGVIFPLDENPESQLWRFLPESIPHEAWVDLKLPQWGTQQSWEVFDSFKASYTKLFCHVNHMSDFMRCSIDSDKHGEEVLQDYLNIEAERTEPYFQKTFDCYERLLDEISEISDSVIHERPNIFKCVQLILDFKRLIYPVEDFEQHAELTLSSMTVWRDRLQNGFELIAHAESLWVADSLGLDGYDDTV